MMQPSVLGPAPSSVRSPNPHHSSSSANAAVSFIPDRAPSFARRQSQPVSSSSNIASLTNNHPRSFSHSHSHFPSAGSDFIHVDRSNNRRMAAAPSDRVDSWIEVGSQPSDSYTSSSSPEDPPVITSGLQVQRRKHRRHRRNSTSTAIPSASRAVEIESSSESEDDEDLDGIDLNAIDSIGSSITDPSLSEGEEGSSEEDEDEEDEDEGEILPVSGFSQYTPAQRPQNNFRTFSRDPPQPDHDAALRASLSTLLSCAAGVGSASKPRPNMAVIQEHARPAPIQTLSLITDSEREAMMAAPPPPPYRRTAHHPPPQPIPREQKRQVSPSRRKEDSTQVSKKSKTRTRRSSKATAATAAIPTYTSISASNMTYLTLAVSAGAVIIVSAISFSAGYALGKEVGRSEMLELGSSGGDIVKRAASGTVGKVGGRIVMSTTGMGSGLRSITVA